MTHHKTICKVAIIGAGNMAREHLCAFTDVPTVEVVGIHSRTRARAEALASEFNLDGVYNSIHELYQNTNADLLVIAVPVFTISEISMACLKYPWTLLLEKPSGYNLADGRKILQAAQQQKRNVFVGLNRRFLSSTQAVYRSLKTQEGIRYIHVQDQQNQSLAASVGHPKTVVENWMYANSIHVVDYLRLFGRGQVKQVNPIFHWSSDASVVLASVEFDSGDRGVYEGIWSGPGPWAVSVTTPSIRWEMRPLEQATWQNTGERQIQIVDGHPWDEAFKPGLRLQAEHAVSAALGQPSACPTLEEALDTMQLISEIFKPNQ